MLKKIIGLCFLIRGLSMVYAQGTHNDYIAENYLLQERLVDGLVFDILQDNIGYLWFGTEYGLVKYDGFRYSTFRHAANDPMSLADNVITCLAEDEEGHLWVGTMNGGLHFFDRRYNTFTRYGHVSGDSCALSGNKINKIIIDEYGTIWVTVEGGGINLLPKGSACFKKIRKPDLPSNYVDALLRGEKNSVIVGHYFGISEFQTDHLPRVDVRQSKFTDTIDIVKVLAKDYKANLWMGTRDEGLYFWSTEQRQLTKIPLAEHRLGQENIWDIYPQADGEIWVATDEGLYVVKPTADQHNQILGSYRLTESKRALSIEKSKDGTMWIGTNRGVLVFVPRHRKFNFYQINNPDQQKELTTGITCLTQASKQQLWVGSVRGLYQFDVQKRIFHQDFFKVHAQLKTFAQSNLAHIYVAKNQDLWICTINGFNNGFHVFRYQPEKNLLVDYGPRFEPFRAHITYQITEDDQQTLWFANGMGLISYDQKTEQLNILKHIEGDTASLSSNFVTRVYFSSQNELWVGTNDQGLNSLVPGTHSFKHWPGKNKGENDLSSPRVLHLSESPAGELWIGTSGGFNILSADRRTMRKFYLSDGLPDEMIHGVINDEDGNLWLSSPHALSNYDHLTGKFTNFDRQDGIQENEFWDRTIFKDDDNRIYVGGDKGITLFKAQDIQLNLFVPKVTFTDLYIANQKIEPHTGNKLLPQSLDGLNQINLEYQDKVFTLQFAALNYIRPDKVQFSIKLEGFEHEWQKVGNRRDITYTNLNPGRYTFKVKAANNDGLWNDQEFMLPIRIFAPWWLSITALVMYAVAIILIIWVVHRLQINRHNQMAETLRLKELDAFKTRFYTNITHEFRTPLTLILGPVEQSLQKGVVLKKIELNLIRQNAQRLLGLINQILEFNKLDAGKSQVHLMQGDLIQFVNYIRDNFQLKAKEKNITLDLMTSEPSFVVDFDPEKLTMIISNLISNALKFTPESGTVTVQIHQPKHEPDPKHYSLVVTDSGTGISTAQMPHIFERFYIAHENNAEGTGIGLALVKELTESMGGKVMVTSAEGSGSRFSIVLPFSKQSEYKLDQRVQATVGDSPEEYPVLANKLSGSHVPLLLIVEDNRDVAHFIGETVKDHFLAYYAYDGQSGLTKARELIPDIIISDIMMQGMDGMALLKRLKEDDKTSHIPVVFVTAKADDDTKLEGLRQKADAYLPKPINHEELILVLNNLVNLIRQTQRNYALTKFHYHEKETEHHVENIFLARLRSICEQYIHKADFSVEDLCLNMQMSHSQLHRKVVALTGESIQKFINAVRLSKARELLIHSSMNISQIAYQTGFSDPAYFAKVFHKEFGQSPMAWRKNT